MTIELAPIPEHGRSGPVRLSRETRAALVAAAGERLVIHATADPDVVTIGATSWVGALAVPGHVVRVTPKVSVTNFFAMLGAGVSPDAFDHEHVTWSDTDELIDGVAYFAIRLIDSATMRGLVHGYVPRGAHAHDPGPPPGRGVRAPPLERRRTAVPFRRLHPRHRRELAL